MQKNNIYVQDNFFDKNFLKKLQREIVQLSFSSRYADLKKTLEEGNPAINNYQRNIHHVELKEDAPVVLEVIKKIKKYFNYEVKDMESNYFLTFPNTPPIPHSDDFSTFNCLIYILGDKLMNNGTGFYEKAEDNFQLHSHVGFKENRAIFFDSRIMHSPLQFAGNATSRYIMSNFIDRHTYHD
jgi:type I site-specific restriction endonuclease